MASGQSKFAKAASNPLPLAVGDEDPYLIQCFLGPQESLLRSV